MSINEHRIGRVGSSPTTGTKPNCGCSNSLG
jgi:hypothetical protein